LVDFFQQPARTFTQSGRHSRARADPLEAAPRLRLVNEILGALRLEKHPDKTFIGRIERGFRPERPAGRALGDRP
jgi:hypothetical protein